MIKLPPLTKAMKPEEFFGKLFQLRNQIHLAHLATKSFSEHKALNEYYDGILDLTDSLVESYQGKYGIVTISVPVATKVDAIPTLKAIAALTDSGAAYNMFKETWIKNQLDEISQLTYETLYKLTNLK